MQVPSSGCLLYCKPRIFMITHNNRPLPSSKNPHFHNEARCTTVLVKMSFICMRMKNDFHIKGWASTLVLEQRRGGGGGGGELGNVLFIMQAFFF